MRNETIYVVDYESGSSMIREFMSNSDYTELKKLEESGAVRIVSYTDISSMNR